jgi:succinate-acetate transporter protein
MHTSPNGKEPVTVTLRPLGSSLPLGALALVPAGLLMSGLQLGWFAPAEATTIAFVLLGFAVPLQFVASVFAFLARDSLVGTGFAVFTGIWLAFGLTEVSGSVGQTSHVLGVFFLACATVFAILMAGGIAGGKAAAGAVILSGSARFVLSGLFELTGSTGVEQAAGVVGLVFVAVAAYVGLATLLEDNAHRSILPIGRRGSARTAIDTGLHAQMDAVKREAGVREQL